MTEWGPSSISAVAELVVSKFIVYGYYSRLNYFFKNFKKNFVQAILLLSSSSPSEAS